HEAHALRDPEPPRLRLERRTRVAIADDDVDEVLVPAPEARERAQERVVVLARRDPGDRDDRALALEAEPRAERGHVPPGRAADPGVEGEVDDRDPLRGNADLLDLFCHPAPVREEERGSRYAPLRAAPSAPERGLELREHHAVDRDGVRNAGAGEVRVEVAP